MYINWNLEGYDCGRGLRGLSPWDHFQIAPEDDRPYSELPAPAARAIKAWIEGYGEGEADRPRPMYRTDVFY